MNDEAQVGQVLTPEQQKSVDSSNSEAYAMLISASVFITPIFPLSTFLGLALAGIGIFIEGKNISRQRRLRRSQPLSTS